jgi:hypothetical protein
VALLTSVIFDHSLKVRVLHAPDDPPPPPPPVPSLDLPKSDVVADTAASRTSPGGEGSTNDTATSASSTVHSRSATSTSGSTAVDDMSANKKMGKKEDNKPKKKQDLVGRLSTLVTSGWFCPALGVYAMCSCAHRYEQHHRRIELYDRMCVLPSILMAARADLSWRSCQYSAASYPRLLVSVFDSRLVFPNRARRLVSYIASLVPDLIIHNQS